MLYRNSHLQIAMAMLNLNIFMIRHMQERFLFELFYVDYPHRKNLKRKEKKGLRMYLINL